MTDEIDIERFARHIVLREIGGPGQQALARAIAAMEAGRLVQADRAARLA